MAGTFNVHEAKTQLSRLLERAERGEEIIIARAGRPVAKLVAIEPRRAPRQFGLCKGKIWIAPDFDATPPELVRLFEDGE
jgi:prevent-host-death family protein